MDSLLIISYELFDFLIIIYLSTYCLLTLKYDVF